jgi:phosphate transport system permease protein
MIVGSVLTTIGALIIGAPIGILSAVFLAFYCPKKIYPVLKSGVQLLAGIPSVVYGFFGLMVLVPFVREVFGGRGLSVLTASVLLGMMILPTIISVSESSIRAVNTSYYEGSVGLGATHERSIFRCVLPACKSGIMTGVVLGLGRAIGETMAVIMVAGNQAAIPKALTDGVRTMTTNIVMEMGYAVDLHRQALIGTAVVLFIFILIINFLLAILKRGDQQND